MSKPLRVIQYGLGAIGRAAARLALTKPGIKLVGAVDRDPEIAGRELADVLGLRQKVGVTVSDRPVVLFAQTRADAVIHCTSSRFLDVYEQLTEIVRAGLHCVTSCEEALFPYHRRKVLAGKLDDLCIRKNVAVVGTGVNPGFVLDTLPLALTAVCQRVDAIRALRVVNVLTRREALQRKVGVGMSRKEFLRLAREGKIGHVGLTESLVFIADALGWKIDKIKETLVPVLTTVPVKTEFLTVKNGQVVGQHQTVSGTVGGREVARLELQMYAGAKHPRDEIEIQGDPPLRMVVESGVPGDIATPAILVNMLPRLIQSPAGLHTMRTLGLPYFAG